jgi:metal-dependent amidase/aminoacylase/carboxypeptidase family protein|tara:strand:+ start:6562 stop:6765 length:204 start_codon:yes stop_codon:yes gene_type:complete
MIYAQTFAECIKELIANNLTETIELRRGFHQNAELNNCGFKTLERIAKELKKHKLPKKVCFHDLAHN